MVAGIDTSFKIRNTLVVNTAFSVNATGIYFSNTFSLNSTFYVGQSAFVNTAGVFTVSGNLTVSNAFIAGGSSGSLGQALLSANTYVYWATLADSATINTTNASNITTGQMNYARVSGLAASATTDTTNATNISSGTLNSSRLPAISSGMVSGLATSATTDTTNATNITTGAMGTARISGLAASATTDTTNATNISSGTLAQARLTNVVLTNTTAQVISGGVRITPYSIGIVSSGTTTLDTGNGPLQYLTNNGAFTLAAPANDGSCVLLITNGSSAGAVANSGFTNGTNVGDAITTTNGNKFMWYVLRINGVSTFSIKALQV